MFSSMSRRSTPQQKTDRAAFPVQVHVLVPETGFGPVLDRLYAWLETHIGRSEYGRFNGQHEG